MAICVTLWHSFCAVLSSSDSSAAPCVLITTQVFCSCAKAATGNTNVNMGLCSNNVYLWTLKFESHVIFTFHTPKNFKY